MTTIATDGKVMAADSCSTASDTVVCLTKRKLTRLPDGSIVGGAGEAAPITRAIHCLHDPSASPDDYSGEFTLIRLHPCGKISRYEGTLFPMEVQAPVAIGSGFPLALGALLAGADAKRAVEIACQRDPFSGGEVVVMEPDRPESNVVKLSA